eukprot:GCRY01002754.1.p1 GENE.GCRY01002754.1~~GCRY01002754.1.p1  ORF type:complete len:1277 (-),score=458.89 GCRY01002754.1:265-4095(-)
MSREKKEYQVQVHIIEARDLKGRDSSGMSDPICFIKFCGQKQNTAIQKKTCSCTWDHMFFFQCNLKDEEFNTEKILVSVFDANTVRRNVLIGEYELDMSFIYGEKNHELYRRWVALTDNERQEGIQGYLKVTVTVLGPGDLAATHDDADDDDDDEEGADLQSLVLLPPEMDLIPYELQVRCYRAENLPKMDRMGKCDGYVQAKFAGQSINTKWIKKSYDPVWNEELRIPVLTPTMSNVIEVSLWDHDKASADDLIGKTYLTFTDILSDMFGPRWVNFYGTADSTMREKLHSLTNLQSRAGADQTEYVGRALLCVETELKDDARLASRSLSPIQEPACSAYTIRFDLYEGSEFPSGTAMLENVVVELTIGPHKVRSHKSSKKSKAIMWYQQFEEMRLSFPTDLTQVPDFIINVYAKNPMFGVARIGYVRLQAQDVFGFDRDPEWYALTPDRLSPAFDDGEIPGFLLFRLDFGLTAQCKTLREPLTRPRMKEFQLRAHIYQGRYLLPADNNGLSDPFIKLRLGPKKAKTKVRNATLFPQWYETLVLNVELPANLNLAPKIIMQVFDKDTIGGNDFLGRAEVAVTNLRKKWPGDPKWVPVYMDDPENVDGEILCSFQLIPIEEVDNVPTRSIVPEFKDCHFEASLVGLRGLLPYKMLAIQKPFIELDCGDRKDKSQVAKTKPCDKPTGANPNHLETLSIPVKVPMNPLYAPYINVRVYDSRLLGANTPLVASTSIPLAPYIPWSSSKPLSLLPPPVDDIPGALHEDAESAKNAASADDVVINMTIPEDIAELNAEEETEMIRFTSPPKTAGKVRTIPEVDDQVIGAEDEEDEEKEDRNAVAHELEYHIKDMPFTMFELSRGRVKHKMSLVKRIATGITRSGVDRAVVGRLKGRFRVIPDDAPKEEEPLPLQQMYTPRPCAVRVYITKGMQMVPKDMDGSSDPYLVVRNGKGKEHVIKDSDNYKPNTLQPDFFKCYELPAILPGNSELTVSVFDHDMLPVSHDLIGSTVVDLEDRFFSESWKAMMNKPLEHRTLWSPNSSNPQGKLQMWIEILEAEEALNIPRSPISPPSPEAFQLRAVVWNTKEVVLKDKNMSDIVVTGNITNQKRQKTDTHWRSKNGKGAFNWRMVWDIELPLALPRFKVQVWDRDMMNPNDAIAEANLNFAAFFKKAYKTKSQRSLQRQWIEMTHPNEEGVQGKCELSFDLLPMTDAHSMPVGKGREEPNDHPHLSEPTRPRTSYPPWRMDKKAINFLKDKQWYFFALTALGSIVGILIALRYFGAI